MHSPAALTQWKRPGTCCTGGRVVPRAGLDAIRENFSPPGFGPRTVQPVANRYRLSHRSPLATEKKIKQRIYYLHYINCTIIRYNNTQTCVHPHTCCSLVRPSSKKYSIKKNTIMSQSSNGRVKTNKKIVKNIGILTQCVWSWLLLDCKQTSIAEIYLYRQGCTLISSAGVYITMD
jgi:hypothetical protein